jgi:hypothetical protein
MDVGRRPELVLLRVMRRVDADSTCIKDDASHEVAVHGPIRMALKGR